MRPLTVDRLAAINGKTRRPTVTPEVAGSSPVAPTSKPPARRRWEARVAVCFSHLSFLTSAQ